MTFTGGAVSHLIAVALLAAIVVILLPTVQHIAWLIF